MTLLEELQPGDMVWAKMPLSKKKLKKIEESHRIRPYLVVSKDKNAIYAYQTSSKRQTYANNYETYGIDQTRFGYYRNSHIDLSLIWKVPKKNLIKKMWHLPNLDLSMIAKRLKIQSDRGEIGVFQFDDIPVQIGEGDVISYSVCDTKLAYVYGRGKDSLLCYPLSPVKESNYEAIIINETIFYIDFQHQLIFNDVNSVKLHNIASVTEINDINDQKHKKGKTKCVKEGFYKLGTVFNTNTGRMMYLYKYKDKYCVVNLGNYRIIPQITKLSTLSSSEIVETYNTNQVRDIVKFLYDYIQPSNKFIEIYRNLM